MLPLLAPPVLSTAIEGLSLSVVVSVAVLLPDDAALASIVAPKFRQSSVDTATPIAGFPPTVAFSA